MGLLLLGERCKWRAPVAGDQRLRRPVLPGRGELPSQIFSECAPQASGLWAFLGKASQLSLKAARVTVPIFPRRGLKELIPCETERVHHMNMVFKGSTWMFFGLDCAGPTLVQCTTLWWYSGLVLFVCWWGERESGHEGISVYGGGVCGGEVCGWKKGLHVRGGSFVGECVCGRGYYGQGGDGWKSLSDGGCRPNLGQILEDQIIWAKFWRIKFY